MLIAFSFELSCLGSPELSGVEDGELSSLLGRGASLGRPEPLLLLQLGRNAQGLGLGLEGLGRRRTSLELLGARLELLGRRSLASQLGRDALGEGGEGGGALLLLLLLEGLEAELNLLLGGRAERLRRNGSGLARSGLGTGLLGNVEGAGGEDGLGGPGGADRGTRLLGSSLGPRRSGLEEAGVGGVGAAGDWGGGGGDGELRASRSGSAGRRSGTGRGRAGRSRRNRSGSGARRRGRTSGRRRRRSLGQAGGVREAQGLELDGLTGVADVLALGLVEGGEGSGPGSLLLATGDGSGREGPLRGRPGSGGPGGGASGGLGRGPAASGLVGVGDAHLALSADVLPQLSLEGAAVGVEDELAGEAGADGLGGGLGGLGSLEGQGGATVGAGAKGEVVELGVEVEVVGSSGPGPGPGGGGAAGGQGSGGQRSLCLVVGDGDQVAEAVVASRGRPPPSRDGGVTGTLGGGALLLLLLLLLLLVEPDPLPLPDVGLGDLLVGQLHSLGGPEPLVGADGILSELLEVVLLLLADDLSVLVQLAWQSAHVGELPPHALWVDVAVLAAGDAVDAARLLPEAAVLSDVSEGEGSVLVLVAVPLDGAHGRLLLGPLGAAGTANLLLIKSLLKLVLHFMKPIRTEEKYLKVA